MEGRVRIIIANDGKKLSFEKNKKKVDSKSLKKAIKKIRDSVIDYVDEPAIR